MNDKTKSKPVHKIRAGTVELAIWKNDSDASYPHSRPGLISYLRYESSPGQSAGPGASRSPVPPETATNREPPHVR
jgi:hypothetical protein